MRQIPLLMTGRLVTQSLAKVKTETRRLRNLQVVNADPNRWLFTGFITRKGIMYARFGDRNIGDYGEGFDVKCPYGVPGDILWVRENWHTDAVWNHLKPIEVPVDLDIWYAADGHAPNGFGRLRPSIHMPRWASRVDLKVVSIHVERLHDITEDGARFEGMPCGVWPVTHHKGRLQLWEFSEREYGTYTCGFMYTWVKLNGVKSWDANPWVWVVKYRVVKPTKKTII